MNKLYLVTQYRQCQWSEGGACTCMFVPQMEPSESASSSNLSLAKPRPNSELNGQSPSHPKVQRSVSSNHKQRRYSEQGEVDTFTFLSQSCLSVLISFKKGCDFFVVVYFLVERAHSSNSAVPFPPNKGQFQTVAYCQADKSS